MNPKQISTLNSRSRVQPRNLTIYLLLILVTTLSYVEAQTLQNVPRSLDKQDLWKGSDLIQPAELASILTNRKAPKPTILNIGVVEDIQGSKNIGAASKKENLDKLSEELKDLPKNTFIVIYCGCCPFEKCPNIRPAFNLMKSMGFSNGKLLNIAVNLKQNWINKGYPLLSQNEDKK